MIKKQTKIFPSPILITISLEKVSSVSLQTQVLLRVPLVVPCAFKLKNMKSKEYANKIRRRDLQDII